MDKISDYWITSNLLPIFLNFNIGIVKGKAEGFEMPGRRKQSTVEDILLVPNKEHLEG